MSKQQRWGPFTVLCALWALSIVLGAYYRHSQYGPWAEYVSGGVASVGILYAFIMARRQREQ